MGIHDRDYYRDESRGIFDGWGRWSATTWLIVVSCCAFAIQLFGTGNQGRSPFMDLFVYDFGKMREGEAWRLLTPLFLNFGILSLFCSMLTLYWAGQAIEGRNGSREFFAFYLGSGILAYGVYFAIQLLGVARPGAAWGPNPSIIAVLVLFACHYPRATIYLIIIPIPAWALVCLYLGFAIMSTGASGAPLPAFLAAALFALLYYRFNWRITGWIPSWPARSRSRPRSAPRLRVVRPEPDDREDEPEPEVEAVPAGREPSVQAGSASESFESRVDRVLEKVSKHGQESLSAEEREILFRASEHYKNRRK